MAAVGGVTCDFVHGNVSGLKTALDVWHPPGHSGYGAQDLGEGASGIELRVVLYGTLAAVETWIDAIEALVGTLVSVTDDHGTIHASVLLTGASLANRQGRRFYDAESSAVINGVRGEMRLEGVICA